MNPRAEEQMDTHFQADRSTPRVDLCSLSVSILYKLIPEPKNLIPPNKPHIGKILNLSKGGVCIEGPLPHPSLMLPLGRGDYLIGINIVDGDEIIIKALGQVRWIYVLSPGKYRFGLQFVKLSPEHRTALSTYLIKKQIRKITGRVSGSKVRNLRSKSRQTLAW